MRSFFILSLVLGICNSSFSQTVYTFNGNGNWSIAANWLNNVIPPEVLPSGSEIIIDPTGDGTCILDTTQIIATGAIFTVTPGKKFVILGELAQKTGASPIDTYFSDTTERFTGFDSSSAEELSSIPIVQYSDTSFFPSQGGPSLNSLETAWEIDVPTGGHQERRNSCTAWSLCWGILGYLNKISEKNETYSGEDKNFSPDFVWHQLNVGQNKGIQFPHALQLLIDKGDCKYVDMPKDPISVSSQPTALAKDNALNYRIENFKRFDGIDIEELKFWLRRNCPLAFAAKIDEGFVEGDKMGYIKKAGERYVWINPSGAYKDLHAMVLCGYDDAIQAFKVLNSWGSTWGRNGGFVWIDYHFFKRIVRDSELFLVIPRKPDAKVLTTSVMVLSQTNATSTITIENVAGTSISETGFCYSKNINPTIASTLQTNITIPTGTTEGNYSSSLLLLSPETQYYLRAYARTDKGIVYGNEMAFYTKPDSNKCDVEWLWGPAPNGTYSISLYPSLNVVVTEHIYRTQILCGELQPGIWNGIKFFMDKGIKRESTLTWAIYPNCLGVNAYTKTIGPILFECK